MSRHIPGNQEHLTFEDRIYIENELKKDISFKDIAKFLCKVNILEAGALPQTSVFYYLQG